MENNMIIGQYINEYIHILANTIIYDYLINDEKFKLDIFLEMLEPGNLDSLTAVVKDYIIPKQLINLNSVEAFFESFNSLYKETYLNHFKLLSVSEEKLVLKNQGIPQNKILSKKEADDLLTKIKRLYVDTLEFEIKKYKPEVLLFIFYGIADQLAVLSILTTLKLDKSSTINFPLVKENPFSILTALISNMDLNNIIQTSKQIGIEKQLIDIIFNIVYKVYNNPQQDEEISYQTKIDIRRIYQLSYMIMKSNLLLKSNELLYEQSEFLEIKDWIFVQSGNFEEKIMNTLLDILDFDYNQDIINKVFDKYSKLEGFCPKDLMHFSLISSKGGQAQIHLKSFDKEKLKDSIIKVTNVKDYGVDRFLKVLTLKNDINDIADSKNKISILPFLELNNGIVLYSDSLLMQASHVLETRMLQQSFTSNKRLQKFISKNYDEIGIADLVKNLITVNLPYLEHINLDKVEAQHIKKLINTKGITKEFDLIFIKNNILYVIEYKTWKISSYNIIQVLNEQKKISRNIESHIKAIEIVKKYPNEFRKLFGEEFNKYKEIELIMVFQNPTAFKYLNKTKKVNVYSPKVFNEFLSEL